VVVADRRDVGVGDRKSTWGTRIREPDDFVLHLLECEGVTIINVGEKFFVRLLVAGGFREVKAHESDEVIDVLDCHGLHVAELRSRGVDRVHVVKSRSHGVSLEVETRLEATSEELVRDRCTGDGVQKENFRQSCVNVIRHRDGVTCLGPRVGALPKVASPAVSSASVISSSVSCPLRSMVSKPAPVVTKARAAALSCCPSGRKLSQSLPRKTQLSGGRVHVRWAAAVWHG